MHQCTESNLYLFIILLLHKKVNFFMRNCTILSWNFVCSLLLFPLISINLNDDFICYFFKTFRKCGNHSWKKIHPYKNKALNFCRKRNAVLLQLRFFIKNFQKKKHRILLKNTAEKPLKTAP